VVCLGHSLADRPSGDGANYLNVRVRLRPVDRHLRRLEGRRFVQGDPADDRVAQVVPARKGVPDRIQDAAADGPSYVTKVKVVACSRSDKKLGL